MWEGSSEQFGTGPSVFTLWCSSLWVWEGDIGVWLLLQLNTNISDTVKDKVRRSTNTGVHSYFPREKSHLITTCCVEDIYFRKPSAGWVVEMLLFESAPAEIYRIYVALGLSDLIMSLFWLSDISVSVLTRQFPSLTFPLVCACVAAGMLGLCVFMCECINEGLHCCLSAAAAKKKKQPGCLPLISSHKSIIWSFYCIINSILFPGKCERGCSHAGGCWVWVY